MAKVTQTRDVQSQTFGFSNGVASAFASVYAKSAATISSLVITTAQTLVTNALAGQMVLVSSNATFGTSDTVYYGLILSNTNASSASTITVDAWYSLAGVKQAGTVANSGVFYIVLPVAPPFWYIALSDSTSAVAGTETGAAMGGTELTTNGLARAQVNTITRTVGSTAATLANTFTYTTNGAQNIGRGAIVNSQVGTTNYAYFIDQINSGTPATVSSNGDTFTPTWTLTLG